MAALPGYVSNLLRRAAGRGEGVIRILTVVAVGKTAEERDFYWVGRRDYRRHHPETSDDGYLTTWG